MQWLIVFFSFFFSSCLRSSYSIRWCPFTRTGVCVFVYAPVCVCARVPSRARYTHAVFVRFNNRLPGVVIWYNYTAWNKRNPFVVDIEFCFSNFCRLAIFVWEKKDTHQSLVDSNQPRLLVLQFEDPSAIHWEFITSIFYTWKLHAFTRREFYAQFGILWGFFFLILVISFIIVVVFDEFYLQRWACVRIN